VRRKDNNADWRLATDRKINGKGEDRSPTAPANSVCTLPLSLARAHNFGSYVTFAGGLPPVALRSRSGKAPARDPDPDAADHIYRQLSEIFRTDLPFTFLFPAVGTHVVHRRIQGLSSPWRGDVVQFMEELWLEEEDR